MIRLLVFLLFVFALGLGFAWLAERPGEMVVTFGGYEYRVTLMVAAVLVTALVAAVMILWWLTKSIWNSPYYVARYFRVRRRDRGYQALSTGMIAAGAGDAVRARQAKKQALKLISADREPLVHLLDAQASLLEGDHEAARAKFEAMLDDPETRLLGLRGLYLEAERLGDRQAARHYAGRAAEAAPQLAWAADATLEEKTEAGDWDGALKIVDAQKATKQVEREAAGRRRAVLLTAKAMSIIDADPAGAKAAALEAHRLDRRLVPAAVIAARAYFRQDDVRKGAKLLEATWKLEPHPEIAEAYVHARPGDSVRDRLARAKRLQSIKQNHAESAVAVARAALDAGDFRQARASAETALRLEPREGVYLLLADIEEAQTGDQGRVRQYLSRALRAPRDPAWVADGYVAERWAPISPLTGRLDAFEWRAPVERIGQIIEQEEPETALILPAALAAPAAAPAVVPVPTPESPPVEEPPADAEVIEAEPAEPQTPGPEPAKAEPAKAEPAAVSAKSGPDARAARPEDKADPEPESRPAAPHEPSAQIEPAGQPGHPEKAEEERAADPPPVRPARPAKENGAAPARPAAEGEEPVPMRLPDDPGVDPDEERAEEPRRFRLF